MFKYLKDAFRYFQIKIEFPICVIFLRATTKVFHILNKSHCFAKLSCWIKPNRTVIRRKHNFNFDKN